MGNNSVAGIPIKGKVNNDYEILLNCYALAYDSHNELMIGRSQGHPKKTTSSEIRKRFSELKRISRKYAPGKLRTIEAIERLALDNHAGKISDLAYISRLRMISMQHNINPMMLNQAESRIRIAESMNNSMKPMENPFRKMNSKNPFENIFKNIMKENKHNERKKNPFMASGSKRSGNKENPMGKFYKMMKRGY